MKKPEPFDIVISHSNCYDGMTAAWVAKKHSPDAEFVFAQHGDKPPDVLGKRVLIVDFSYPRDQLAFMVNCAKDLLVLDHHKSAEIDLQDFMKSGSAIFETSGDSLSTGHVSTTRR